MGAIAVSVYLAPKLGIVASVLIISSVNFVFGIWLILKKK